MSEVISVPRKDWLELKRLLRQASQHQVEWITEKQVCELLDIKKSTLISYVSKGKITMDMYRIGVNGARFYDKEKIMGQPFKM
jgi:hypothetical protein